MNQKFLANKAIDGQTMTVQGTVNNTFILFFILLATAMWSWSKFSNPESIKAAAPFLLIGLMAGIIAYVVLLFKPTAAPICAPIYAASQGIILGVISMIFERSYPGIVVQAVGLTFATLFCMLTAYKTGWIQATEGFKKGVIIATMGIAVFYFVVWAASWFGIAAPAFIAGGGILGIGFSLFVVGIAALNLVLDFDFIENASKQGLAKHMEWYGAFALMVTMIWLYMEILRLLSKINRRD